MKEANDYFLETENKILEEILNGKYQGTHAIYNWVVDALCTTKILSDEFNKSEISILYSEALFRFRTATLIANRGYYSDGLMILRSVYEIVKAINAIQNGIIDAKSYLTGFTETDERLTGEELIEKSEAHAKKMDNLVNNFDDKDIPQIHKENLKIFKDFLYKSVHKSSFNIILRTFNFYKNSIKNPFEFLPDPQLYELYFNSFCFIMLMYMRCLLKSKYIRDSLDKYLFKDRIDTLEEDFLNMNSSYQNDIIKYIQIKYNYN